MANKEQLRDKIKELKRSLKSLLHKGKSIDLHWGKFDRDKEDYGVAVHAIDYYLSPSRCQEELNERMRVCNGRNPRFITYKVIKVGDSYYDPEDYNLEEPLRVEK